MVKPAEYFLPIGLERIEQDVFQGASNNLSKVIGPVTAMTNSALRLVAILFVAAFCASCTSRMNVTSAIDAYRNARSCCSDFSQISFEKIADRREFTFAVGSDSPAFNFDNLGLSYFRAFELPTDAADFTLIVRSYLFTDSSAKTGAFFYPQITLLDTQKRQIVTTTKQQMTYIKSSFADEPNSTHGFQVSIPVRQADNARYVLIHTFPDLIGLSGTLHGQSADLAVPLRGSVLIIPSLGDTYSALGSPVAPPEYLKLRMVPATK